MLSLLRCLPILLLALTLSAPVPAQDSKSTPAGKLAARLQPFADSHTLAGAVLLVANRDGVLATETVGSADIASGKPMRPDNVFWIASMSKPVTATALMLLIDEGKVALDDPVEKYLPEFKNLWLAVEQDQDHQLLKRPGQKITVRHILSHTSGMPFRSALEQPTLDALPLSVAVRSYAMTPLQFEPTTKYQYSNAGINTAGRIIEVVTGLAYEDFLQQRLFDPLGMQDTTFWPNEEQVARLARAYRPNKDKSGLDETQIDQLQYPLNRREGRYPMPAGGLFSTAADMAAFCRMLLNGGELNGKRYLSADAVGQLAANQTGDLPTGYGLGFSTDKRPNGTFGHGGALATNMQIDRERGLVLIYMVQHAGYPNDTGKQVYPTFAETARALFAK